MYMLNQSTLNIGLISNSIEISLVDGHQDYVIHVKHAPYGLWGVGSRVLVA